MTETHQKCSKMVKRGVMTEARPCIRAKHSGGTHTCTPDLLRLRFGEMVVVSQAPPYLDPHSSRRSTRWNVDTPRGPTIIRACELVNGKSQGKYAARGSGRGCVDETGKYRSEYLTVTAHWRFIFRLSHRGQRYRGYKDMPFFEGWNPRKGGSFVVAARWIIDTLGEKPGPQWSMDVIKHQFGFVPGNLRWALKRTQKHNQQHRVLGQFNDEEFAVEAKRRGYFKTSNVLKEAQCA